MNLQNKGGGGDKYDKNADEDRGQNNIMQIHST